MSKVTALGQSPSNGIVDITHARIARAESSRGLRTRFLDMPYWEELARHLGLGLPKFGTPVTTGKMERWLRTLGISVGEYLRKTGEKNLSEFAARNPDWPFKAWAGLVLELFAEELLGAGATINDWVPEEKPLLDVFCCQCGRFLAAVQKGSQVLCPRCQVWSKPPKPSRRLVAEARQVGFHVI